MLPAEIVLIIIGFALISVSFFLSNKKKNDAEEETATSRDIWTEKDEEAIIKHVDEILNERGMELVDTTEDQMNRICNEKIMAFDEFSKQVLDKINVNHEEVVFMYNMLGEKKKEILEETMQETVEKSVPVISEVESADKDEIQINVTPDTTSGLDRAKRRSETVIVRNDDRPRREEQLPTYTTDRPVRREVKSGIDRAIEAKNAEKSRPVANQTGVERAAHHTSTNNTADIHRTDISRQQPIEHTDIANDNTDRHTRAEVTEELGRPSRESVMKTISETSVNRSNEEIEDRVRQLYREGRSVMDISKEMNLGQGEVKLMIALLKKRS